MSSINTFSNSGLSDNAEFVCLFGLGSGLLGSGGNESYEAESDNFVRRYPLPNSTLPKKPYVPDGKWAFCFNRLSFEGIDSKTKQLNNYFATLLWTRKSNYAKSEATTEPLVDIEDVEQIRTNFNLFKCGVRTVVSKKLRKKPGSPHHKMLRAISAAQLLWEESFESDAQDEY